MDALVMCGGEGTRLDANCEKPLYEVGGRPMIDRVRDALEASDVDAVTAVVSPATPETRAHVDVPVVEASGNGYVADLQSALEPMDPPVLTVAADLPLLAAEAVDDVLGRYERCPEGSSLTVCVPAALKRRLGASVDATRPGDERPLAPSGVNVVGSHESDEVVVSWDTRLAVNVNRAADAALAEALL